MKEFIKTQKVTYNLMSFTGFKSLLIFSILADGPKSFDEIGAIVENNPYLKEKMSTDTMRVYMNSLKYVGCNIKRVKGSDKISRYVIDSHPFELKLTNDELESIIKVYKTLVKNMDIKDIIFMDDLLEKIGKYIKNQDFVDKIKKISMLDTINKEILKDLVEYCDSKYLITVEYNSPKLGNEDIDIIADKIEIQNNKLYLCGFGFKYNEYGIFQISRINKIKDYKITKKIPKKIKKTKVRYELELNGNKLCLDDNEKLIKEKDNKAIIEVVSQNKFLLKQKFLELGPRCKILKPESFKNEFISTLKDMKVRYYCE